MEIKMRGVSPSWVKLQDILNPKKDSYFYEVWQNKFGLATARELTLKSLFKYETYREEGNKDRITMSLVTDEIIYNIENFIYRLYIFREKLCQFLNEVLLLGYTDNQINFDKILKDKKIIRLGLNIPLSRFKSSALLSELIKYRRFYTHQKIIGTRFTQSVSKFPPLPLHNPKVGLGFKDWAVTWTDNVMVESFNEVNEILEDTSKIILRQTADKKYS